MLLRTLATVSLLLATSVGAAAPNGIVISQFVTRGPTGGNDEFVELYNTSSSAVDIGGWQMQGCSSGSPGTASNRVVVTTGFVLEPGRYYLFTNSGSAPNYSLGVPGDQTYTTGFTDFSTTNFSGIQLLDAAGTRQDGAGSQQSPCREGAGITTPAVNGASNAFVRLNGGTQDTDSNVDDFAGPGAASPHNSSFVDTGDPSIALSVNPAAFGEAAGTTTVTATLSETSANAVTAELMFAGTATNGSDYTASASSITIDAGNSSGAITLTGIDDAIFEGDESVTVMLGALTNAVAGTPSTVGATITDDDPAPPPVLGARTFEIQGAGHVSTMNGMSVSNVPGIVTAVAGNGFYMQDGDGDSDVGTSDGIFVFTSSAPTAAVGKQVLVAGMVTEFRPGGAAANLTTTQITSPVVTVRSAADLFTNALIAPTVLGNGGRVPPSEVIDDDTAGQVEVPAQTTYDPAQDGIDFYESLEGMLVQVNDARVTGPTNGFGEIWVVGDSGANATGSNARGGITLVERATGVDYNPERIQLDDGLNGIVSPGADVGDDIALARGVVAYNFGNFEVALTELPVVTSNFLPREVSAITTATDRLTVAAYNVENLSPADPEAKLAELASQIVDGLGAPDILALSEVQDNNGPTNDGAVAADLTLAMLIDAIASAGGPSYAFVQIDPVDDQDGGQPGGNIRVVQLYHPARVRFVPGTTGAGDSTTATAVGLSGGELALSLSPGRIAPIDGAWSSSRKPLAVTYDFNGRRVLVINNHFNSKGGDQPLFGVNQPPLLTSEIQRRAQATLVHDFVFGALALDPQARVVVLGDLNDFDFSPPLRILRNGPLGAGDSEGTQPALVNLGTQLVVDAAERYSYVFEGNSQELDHLLSTPSLFAASPQYQAVHTNAEYSVQTSDHDPLIASFLLPANVDPVANAGADGTVAVGTSVSLDGTASSDADGSIESYAWTQTAGTAVTLADADTATPSFITPGMMGALTFRLTITDDEGASAFDEVTITVTSDVDTVPDAFEFTDVPDAPSSEVIVSNAIIVRGIDRKTAISIASSTIARYSINGGRFRAGTATVKNGDQVRLQLVSAIDGGESRSATLTIGGVSDTWTVITAAQDTSPAAFAFIDRINQASAVPVTSNAQTITGINAPTPISIDGDASAMYRINSSAFTNAPGMVQRGDKVRLRVVSGALEGQIVTAEITIGDQTSTWNVTTGHDTMANPVRFDDRRRAQPGALITSRLVTISGISVPVDIHISGDESAMYSINGGAFTSEPGVVNNGDTVQLLLRASTTPGAVVTAQLGVGSVSAAWNVMTRP